MIDAKRLAELMEPGKMTALADGLTQIAENITGFIEIFGSGNHKADVTRDLDLIDCAAAVLREVASAKVIEVDLTTPTDCHFCQYEQGICMVDSTEDAFDGRNCAGDSRKRGATDYLKSEYADDRVEAPPWCPARGRIIIQAKKQE